MLCMLLDHLSSVSLIKADGIHTLSMLVTSIVLATDQNEKMTILTVPSYFGSCMNVTSLLLAIPY